MSSTLLNESTTLLAKLSASLGEPFSLWTRSGESQPLQPVDVPLQSHSELAAELAACPVRAARPLVSLLDHERWLLALSWQAPEENFVAAAVFPTAEADSERGWTRGTLTRCANLAVKAVRGEQRLAESERESRALSENLASTYEEISLLHGLTRRLKLSSSQLELSELALDWLLDCLPAESLFLTYEPLEKGQPALDGEHIKPLQLAVGACCLDAGQRREFVRQLESVIESSDQYARGEGEVGGVHFAGVRHYLAVPICDRDQRLGWIVAVNNHVEDSFCSIEASLMRSVSTILGIHFANRAHYEKQAQLVADVVRALASAIDAKDPYTRGHSERVAQISALLARALGSDDAMLRRMYIGGLLHDIGKIGVDDRVLRKDGRLTDEEFEQIKQHPRLGYNILADLAPLAEVLPIVLHHHERWDGRGYPDQLKGEEIELVARIVAVADSFDAMTSDRPYRRGMPLSKVEQILREGAGSQWDSQVIDAFFQCRDEIVKLVWKQEQGGYC